MAELDIEERQIGDVTVLDLDGSVRMGEGAIALRLAIRRFFEEGKNKLVLNLAHTAYIDSTGIGELVAAYTSLRRANVRVRMANLTEKCQDLLTITKLLCVYTHNDSIEEAVAELASDDVYISCPIYGCYKATPFSDPWNNCRCVNCGAQIFAKAGLSGADSQVSISVLALPTYAQENIRVTAGMPTTITVNGRLDLFASEVLERAWLTVPLAASYFRWERKSVQQECRNCSTCARKKTVPQ